MAGAAQPRLRRWLRRIALGLLVLAVLAIAAVVAIPYTATGTRLALRAGLDWYAGQIRGSIAIDAIEGRLARDLALRGIRVADADGRPLVELAELSLVWRPEDLLDDALRGVRLRVASLILTLPADGERGFADLAPAPGAPPDEAPASDAGPTPPTGLPISLDARLDLDGITVRPRTGPPMVDALSGQIALNANGERVDVELEEVRGAIGVAEVGRIGLDARIGWAPPRIEVSGLAFEGDLGTVRAEDVVVNPAALNGAGRIRAALSSAAAERFVPAIVPRPLSAQIDFDGDPSRLSLSLDAVAGDIRAGLTVGGALQPAPDLDGTLTVRGVDPARFAPEVEGALGLDVEYAVSGPEGPLEALGDVDPATLDARVQARCVGCRISPAGPTRLVVDARLKTGDITVEADVAALGATVSADARATLDGGAVVPGQVDAIARIPSLAPVSDALALPALAGSVELTARCAPPTAAPACDATVGVTDLAAPGIAIGRATVEASATLQPDAPRFDVQLIAAGIRPDALPGVVEAELRVVGSPTAFETELTARRSGGSSDAPIDDRVALAAGVRPGPPVVVDLERLDGRALGVDIGTRAPGRIAFAPAGPRVQAERVRLAIAGAEVDLDGVLHLAGSNELRARIAGADLAHFAELAGRDLAGTVDVTAELRGPAARPSGRVDVDARAVRLDGQSWGDASVRARLEPGRADATLAWDDAPRRARVEVSAPVRVPLSGAPVWLRDEAHALSVSASGIDVAWARTLAAVPDGFDGTVGVEATASGSAGGLTFDATVGGHIAVPELPEMPWALTAKGDQTRQTASLTVDAQPGRALVVQVEAEAPLRDALAGNPAFVPTDIPIDVRATASGVDIAPFGVFAPPAVQSPKGRLDLDAAVTGTIGAPDLRAVVGLRAGELRVSALNQRIHDIELRARVTNRVAAIEQLDFRSGDGRGTVTGEARIGETGTLDAAVGLRLVGFDIVPPGAPPLRVDSRVDVTATRGAAATPAATPAPLDVSVQLRETRVRVRGDPSRTPSPIPENPRIRYVDAAGQAEAAEAPTPEPGPPMPFAFVVDLSDPVRIQGPFLDMAWGGRVEAGQPVDGPLVVAGGVQAEPGSGFELLGNRFQVQRGEVAQPEAGGTPFIDLLAQTDAGEAVVTVTIRGPVDRPELTFGSEPAMPQYQVLTLLITGTTQASEEEEQSVQDQAAGLLAAFGNPELERQMQDRFGIDRVRLSFGETADQPILSVGKHLSRRLYVESQYHHNAPIDENTAELRTRYRLAPSWALETSYGDAAVGGVDVFWWTVFETDE